MGRPRKPTAIKALEGNPGKRDLPENEPDYGELSEAPPSQLDKAGRKAWRYYYPLLSGRGVVQASDLAILTQFCQAVGFAETAAIEVHQDGITIPGARGGRIQHPAMVTWNAATREINNLAGKLGLSPADRSKVAGKPKDDGKSRRAKLLSFDGGKGAV